MAHSWGITFKNDEFFGAVCLANFVSGHLGDDGYSAKVALLLSFVFSDQVAGLPVTALNMAKPLPTCNLELVDVSLQSPLKRTPEFGDHLKFNVFRRKCLL